MEIVEEIQQICRETGNDWFLAEELTKIALYDLIFKKDLEINNIFHFDDRKCVCHSITAPERCLNCLIEKERTLALDTLNVRNNYCDDTCRYTKNKWIIPEKINGEIPGFILINCDNELSHELVFACVREKYRKKGVLKNMIKNIIPKEWNIWLWFNSTSYEIETIFKKCGLTYHGTINDGENEHKIYKRGACV